MRAVHVIGRKNKAVLASFPSVMEALIWKDERDLGAEFHVSDQRPAGDPGKDEERPLLIMTIIREAVLPLARRKQYDFLMSGKTDQLPKDSLSGLEGVSALFGALCLEEACASGWSAVQGHYTPPVSHYARHATEASRSVPHAWIAHESGAIMDLSRKVFKRSPLTFLTAQEGQESGLVPDGPLESRNDLVEACDWLHKIGSDVIPRIRFMGASFFMERKDVRHDLDRSLDPEEEVGLQI